MFRIFFSRDLTVSPTLLCSQDKLYLKQSNCGYGSIECRVRPQEKLHQPIRKVHQDEAIPIQHSKDSTRRKFDLMGFTNWTEKGDKVVLMSDNIYKFYFLV